MNKLFFVGLIGGVLLTSASCKEDPPAPEPAPVNTVRIDVQPIFNGANLYLDSTYTTAEGHKVQFTDIKFYLEDVRNGSVLLTDAMLFDYGARGTQLYDGEGEAGNFGSLSANLGVGPANNNSDPTEFPNDSWLNISNSNDMHWGWNPGYIFVKVEARVDTIQDANDVFDHFVILHAGKNENLETWSLSNLNWNSVGSNRHQLSLELDMSEFLQSSVNTIDLQFENSTHSAPGQEALTTKVMENFKEALTP
ncbi:MAG: MbnP family protein [Fluviicola sp.]